MAGRVRARCRVVWALGAGVVVRAAPVELEAPAASARKLRKPCALHVDVHLTGLCTVARCVVCARSGRAVQRVPRATVAPDPLRVGSGTSRPTADATGRDATRI